MRLSALCLVLLAAAVSAVDHSARSGRRHHNIAVRGPQPVEASADNATDAANASEHILSRRFSNARFTFYDVGLGACGVTNKPSDFIVALNTPQYGSGYPGPHCFEQISISYGGKSTIATIMDECPGCPDEGLDFSRGLFDFFASESEGVLYGTWNYVGSGGSGGDSTPTTSTSTYVWTPTTTSTSKWSSTSTYVWTPTTTSTTWTPETTSTSSKKTSTWSSSSSSTWSSSSSTWTPTSTSTWWSSSSSTPTSTSTVWSSASYDLASGVASGLAVTTGSQALTPSQAALENIYDLDLGIIGLGAVVAAGAQANAN